MGNAVRNFLEVDRNDVLIVEVEEPMSSSDCL